MNTKQIIIKYSTKEGYCTNITSTSTLKSLKVHLKQKSTQLNCSYLKILNTWSATKTRQFSICAIIVQNKMRAMWSFSVTRRSTLTSYTDKLSLSHLSFFIQIRYDLSLARAARVSLQRFTVRGSTVVSLFEIA